MSRAQDPHKPLFPFGNPFKKLSPKGSYLSPRLLEVSNSFEGKLSETVRKLVPANEEDVLSLSWMKRAMESLCMIHTDIKSVITSLELPSADWDEKWVHVYLDNSIKLLDICIAFSSEISKLSQGHLHLQYAVHSLSGSDSTQFIRARSSLDSWKQHISNSKNSSLENCFEILDNLVTTLDLPKMKNSAKGKVLMRAMYGLKVVTIFVCNAFAAGFSGSAKNITDLHLSETFLWSEAFTNLQSLVNGEIRNIYSSGKATVLKELEAVDTTVKKLYPIVQNGGGENFEAEAFKNSVSELSERDNKLSQGLDVLAKEVDAFFQIVLLGRDALLSNLRVGTKVCDRPPTTPRSGGAGRVEGLAR